MFSMSNRPVDPKTHAKKYGLTAQLVSSGWLMGREQDPEGIAYKTDGSVGGTGEE